MFDKTSLKADWKLKIWLKMEKLAYSFIGP